MTTRALAPITASDLTDVARQLDVGRVVLVDRDDLTMRIVYADERGRLAVPEVLVRREPVVAIDFVFAHAGASRIVARFGETVTADDEMSAEVEKHHAIFDRLRAATEAAVTRGEDRAAGELDDHALCIEGEWRWWEDARARGDLEDLDASAQLGGGQTTAVVAAIHGDKIRGASVGDSGAWLSGADVQALLGLSFAGFAPATVCDRRCPVLRRLA